MPGTRFRNRAGSNAFPRQAKNRLTGFGLDRTFARGRIRCGVGLALNIFARQKAPDEAGRYQRDSHPDGQSLDQPHAARFTRFAANMRRPFRLKWASFAQAPGLFDGPEPQMRLTWFETLAAATLAPGEQAGIALLEEEGEPCAALALALDRHGIARGLTAPYTSTFSVASRSDSDAMMLGAQMGQLGLGALMLDCLDETALSNRAFLAGLAQSGLVNARYRHFANWL